MIKILCARGRCVALSASGRTRHGIPDCTRVASAFTSYRQVGPVDRQIGDNFISYLGACSDIHMPAKTFIETYQVEAEVCDQIARFFEQNRHMAQPGRLGENPRIDKSMKDSLDITIPIKMYGHFDTFFDQLLDSVKAYLDTYYYSVGADGLGPLWLSQHANIQWYPKGGGYPAVHCERDRLEYSHRALVWMLYLTDTPGGGTAFPHQDVITECEKGKLIIWPSDMTHMHHGVVSTSHEKMIFTGWIDFVRPPRSTD